MTANFLLNCIGDISDEFLEEAEFADVVAYTRKRAIKYGALATAATVGIAVTVWWLKLRRTSARAA